MGSALVRTRIRVGETLDQRYNIVEVVDEAASGVVYRALDSKSGDKPVVLKVMHADLSGSPLERERFILEGGMSLKDNRGNLISQVVGSGLIDNRVPYMAIEDFGGKSLKDLLKEHPEGLDSDYALRIGIKVCEALTELHACRIVHRDLKPANIQIVSEDRDNVEVRILEFGLARFVATARRSDTLTRTGMIIGTAAEYMAPEQCRGLLVGPSADIYAAGCIIFEMLAGKPPFQGNSPSEVMHHQLCSPPPDLSVRPCAHRYPRLEQVLWRALAKSQTERHWRAEAFAADLKALLDNTEIEPFKPHIAERNDKETGNVTVRRRLSTLLVLSSCLLLCYLWWLFST